MALIRQTKSVMLFRCLVVPSLLLCCIFRSPLFQWLALVASGIWLATELASVYRPVSYTHLTLPTICSV